MKFIVPRILAEKRLIFNVIITQVQSELTVFLGFKTTMLKVLIFYIACFVVVAAITKIKIVFQPPYPQINRSSDASNMHGLEDGVVVRRKVSFK